MCDTWQAVYRALCPRYSTATLAALVAEIEAGGKRLIHGSTTDTPLWANIRQKCEGACLIGWLEAQERGWLNEQGQPATVDDVERWFDLAVASVGRARWPVLGYLWDDPHNLFVLALVRDETRLIIEERRAA